MKHQLPYEQAKQISDTIYNILQPHCHRIEIAGSIRRKKSIIGDVEIVCIPKPYETGLFETGLASIVNHWQKVRGELNYQTSKYTQRIIPLHLTNNLPDFKLDLFFASEENFGHILAIRTGSSQYSHKVLANGWVKAGFTSNNGMLFKDGERYPIREEIDLFKLIGVPYVEPELRNL